MTKLYFCRDSEQVYLRLIISVSFMIVIFLSRLDKIYFLCIGADNGQTRYLQSSEEDSFE